MSSSQQLVTGYQRLETVESACDEEHEQHERNPVVHVAEGSKARWNHLEDLDEFFTRVYQYHQRNGFLCMILSDIFDLIQFIFVVAFTTFLISCVNYPVLFAEKTTDTSGGKITLGDTVYSAKQCSKRISPGLIICLLIALLFWIFRLIKFFGKVFLYWEIRSFYITALNISSEELPNTTWHEVMQKTQKVQKEQQMCIHKEELTELDIYNRILRFHNYWISLVNKNLLPPRFNLPFVGELVFLTTGLKYNLELLLFWGPGAAFENNWHLRMDFRQQSQRKELAEKLSKKFWWVGVCNLFLSPFILMWQICYLCFKMAELLKRDPSILGSRRWSLFGRLYLRHYNELDHEFNARLNRGYKPATLYTNAFLSPLGEVFAQNIAFIAASFLAALVVLTVYDEDVLQVEHVLTLITCLGIIVAACRLFIPDENQVWCPERLLQLILAQIHYIPDHWKGRAHSWKVRDEFSQYFQYKLAYFIEEVLSPVVTPLILMFWMPKKSLDIIDFLRNFTVEVQGVGDICSFAQMNVKKHGNPRWLSEDKTEATQYQQAEDGKTELSLMHFTMTNPNWQPPPNSQDFINALKVKVKQDTALLQVIETQNHSNALATSLNSITFEEGGINSLMSGMVLQQAGMVTSLARLATPSTYVPQPSTYVPPPARSLDLPSPRKLQGGLAKTEGPLDASGNGLLASIHDSLQGASSSSLPSASLYQSDYVTSGHKWQGFNTADMNFSAVYIHQLHDRAERLEVSGGEHSQLSERDEVEHQMWKPPTPEKEEGEERTEQMPAAQAQDNEILIDIDDRTSSM